MKLVKTFGRSKAAADALIETLERRGAVSTARVEPVVRRILAEVRKSGDRALLKYATKFDGLAKGQKLLVSREEMKAAWETTAPKLQAAMMVARGNILAFAEAQLPREWTISPVTGVKTGQIVRPLDSVGCYVPGGRYPLPSTLLMTVTPAQVAGVERIVVCSPKPAKETMAAAWLAGVTEFYRVGGAQAIAAMAFGTATIRRVDKIVGPGNLYVTAAKVLASSECGIDMPAGPTEIVVTSETGNAAGIAADLVAQAEHDPEALAVLITSNEALAKEVAAQVKIQVRGNALAKTVAWRAGLHICNRYGSRGARVDESVGTGTFDGGCRERSEVGSQCGIGVCGRSFAAVNGGLRLWTESCAADRTGRACSWRVERDGFREGDHGAAVHATRAEADGSACDCTG